MGANLTIYCLEEVTDYFEFERLCHDLMALEGYHAIEPLDGFSDKGRDAIHVNRSGQTTIFAYSVREDWRAKLAGDAREIHKHGHQCDTLVFITTSDVTAGQRDEAVESIRNRYGWELDLFPVERLRILLDVHYPHTKWSHPHIFPPAFLKIQEQLGSTDRRDHLFISYAPGDNVLAEWLARRLTAEGYFVWCNRFKALGGEPYPEDVDRALAARTFRVIGLYSQSSLSDPETVRQRSIALHIGKERGQEFLIPLNVDSIIPDQLDQVTRTLPFITFGHSWARGLAQLLDRLESSGCPKSLMTGKMVAAKTLLVRDVLSDERETLFSNCLKIERLPNTVYRLQAETDIPREKAAELRFSWAYRRVNEERLLSFEKPPSFIKDQYGITEVEQTSWADTDYIEGIRTRHLIRELIRKSLVVKCHEKGLLYCHDAKLQYFPSGLAENDRLKLVRPDGLKTFVLAAGKRTYYTPKGLREYQYHLAPTFEVRSDLTSDFMAILRVRLRFCTPEGRAITGKAANARRKNLTDDWWNKEWFNRFLAVCQYLADDGTISIGEEEPARIVIDMTPAHLDAAFGVDETALDALSVDRQSLLGQESDDLDEDVETSEVPND